MNILQNSLVTLVALIWLLPSMISHIHVNEMVSPQINILKYSLVTFVTLVWFLSSVSPHNIYMSMRCFFQHYASSYGLLNYLSLWNPCHIALIWFLPRMNFEMSCKITIPLQWMQYYVFYPECISNILKITICWKYLGRLTAFICFLPRVCFKIT